MKLFLNFVLAWIVFASVSAQKVGIMTDDPKGVLHVFSSGQVLHPDGLLILGNKSEAHMIGDFNYLQSKYGEGLTTLNMYLQPHGGRIGINVPFSSLPFTALHVYGDGETLSDYGLAMIGNKNEGNLTLDFDRIQVKNAASPTTLHLQAAGGDINMASGTLFVDESAGTVGVGDVNPDAALDIISGGSTDATMALQIRSASFNNLLMVKDDGNVGIGTSIPHYDLEVIGNIGITSKLIHSNDDDTFLAFTTDRITLDVGGKTYINMLESDNSQDNIYIGNTDVDVNLNGALYVDRSALSVGIGTIAPDYLLDVNGSMGVSGQIMHNGDNDTYIDYTTDRVRVYAGGVNMLDMYEGNSDFISLGSGTLRVNIDDERVGIGTILPSTDLHIIHGWQGGLTLQEDQDSWRIAALALGGGDLGLYHNGAWRGSFDYADGDYNSASDRRLKKNIDDVSPVMDKIRQLSPKLYHFKTQDDSETKNFGFIAQEVLTVFPEIVSHNTADDLYGLDYNDFAVISIKALQELDEMIKRQQQAIEELASAVQELKADLGR